ncbi:MAG: PIN domain-containing protein [Anaerolineae bacterium]|nr:PIN domain-containing protein [Anaerolineae bacterium]
MDGNGDISGPYVVDTHALFWYLVGSSRLSELGEQVFRRAFAGEATLVLSPIVLLELYGLIRKARAPIDFMAELTLFERPPFRIEPITVDDLRLLDRLDEIPELHDRLIAALALRLQAPILSCDPLISACSEVTCVW